MLYLILKVNKIFFSSQSILSILSLVCMDKYSSKICLPTLLCLDTKSLFSSINNIEVSKYLDVFRGFFQYLSPGRLVSTFHCGNSISQSSETVFDVITTFPLQSIMMCSLVHSIGQTKQKIINCQKLVKVQWLLTVGCGLDDRGCKSRPSHIFPLFFSKRRNKLMNYVQRTKGSLHKSKWIDVLDVR